MIDLNTPRYIMLYIVYKLTMLVNNYAKLVITFINLTCKTELKIYVSWNKTLLDYGIREIVPRVANERDLSHILKDGYRL